MLANAVLVYGSVKVMRVHTGSASLAVSMGVVKQQLPCRSESMQSYIYSSNILITILQQGSAYDAPRHPNCQDLFVHT